MSNFSGTWHDPTVQCSLLGFSLAFRFGWEWQRGVCAATDDPMEMLADLQVFIFIFFARFLRRMSRGVAGNLKGESSPLLYVRKRATGNEEE